MAAQPGGAAQLTVADAALVEVVPPLPTPATNQSDGWNGNAEQVSLTN